MKKSITALAMTIATCFATEQPPARSDHFEQAVADSNPLRVAQANELEAYIQAMKQDSTALRTMLHPDYSSPKAFEASLREYRAAFCNRIG